MYLANDITPACPEHPGGILGEELKARGISQKKFAEQIGMQATHLSALIHGTRNFTPAVAAKIESGLEGISAAIWMKMQEQYNKDTRRRRVDTSKLVSGYSPSTHKVQPALADTHISYGGSIQIVLTIPESDKALLENLAERLHWKYR
ncbi:MAG: HigA family addiction module antidote protein [Bacteroidales bacterium]|nr:HigA family addiction module antidote protein [Bacteroidales bacterium]